MLAQNWILLSDVLRRQVIQRHRSGEAVTGWSKPRPTRWTAEPTPADIRTVSLNFEAEMCQGWTRFTGSGTSSVRYEMIGRREPTPVPGPELHRAVQTLNWRQHVRITAEKDLASVFQTRLPYSSMVGLNMIDKTRLACDHASTCHLTLIFARTATCPNMT